MRGKKGPYEFRGKFVGVRGKKVGFIFVNDKLLKCSILAFISLKKI